MIFRVRYYIVVCRVDIGVWWEILYFVVVVFLGSYLIERVVVFVGIGDVIFSKGIFYVG